MDYLIPVVVTNNVDMKVSADSKVVLKETIRMIESSSNSVVVDREELIKRYPDLGDQNG